MLSPRFSALILHLSLLAFTSQTHALYTILDDFTGSSFLSGFDFFSGLDPTKGWVRYLSYANAVAQGLVEVSTNSVYLGVDYKNRAPNGRASVRLESKKLYQKGLFVLDVAHMPSSTCGTWPSFWTWGSEDKWPVLGEIDIIEGIHRNTINAMSLHTPYGCKVDGKGSLGTPKTLNCDIAAFNQTPNAGCGIASSSASSFGTPFNAAGGGVFATEWTSQSIKMWFFPRAGIPADLMLGGPVEPRTWGTPDASFQGECDFDRHFGRQRVVLNTAFCGDWAGQVWESCANVEKDCVTYVTNNPAAYRESYWRVNYLRIFKLVGGGV